MNSSRRCGSAMLIVAESMSAELVLVGRMLLNVSGLMALTVGVS